MILAPRSCPSRPGFAMTTRIFLDTGEVVLTARLNTRSRAQSGEPLRVAVDVERLHFFDADTEEAIW